MISIITVCYNEKDHIEDTMGSVLMQDMCDYEYIVKDGGSTDGTADLARGMASAFRKRGVSLTVVSEKDGGLYDAMNRAVAVCRGDWVCFMNAGDRFFSDHVLRDIFGTPDAPKDYSGTDLIYGDAIEEEFGEYYFYRKCPELIDERMPFNHQTVFASRQLLEDYPFDLSLRIGADYDFLLHAYKEGKKFTDSGVITALISKEGVSTVKLKDTFIESMAIRKRYGIPQPEGAHLKRKLAFVGLKQFGMDLFPRRLKYAIRKCQRKMRKQGMVDIKQLGFVDASKYLMSQGYIKR